MGILYITVAFVTAALVLVNLVWLGINVSIWAQHGIQYLLQGLNFVESIQYSIFLKWILLADGTWIIGVIIFAFSRKHYKTDVSLHYLKNDPIDVPSICVAIPAYNEEDVIGKVVSDFKQQKNVKYIFVIDNNSSDKTVQVAKEAGATVIENPENMGFAYSCVKGFETALKTDANIIALVEGDGTCSGKDLEKLVPFLDNSDMAVGTRQLQVLSEKGNQNKMIYVWANYYLAKLIQMKFFSLLHRGVVSFTDVGCIYRIIRKEALEKIIEKFFDKNTGKVIPGLEFTVFMPIIALQNDLRVVEVPITFKKRIGESKTGSNKFWKAAKLAFLYIWVILKS